MNKNFSFSFNSNLNVNGKKVFGNKGNNKKNLTAQQEYWMNRFSRKYASKIYLLIIIFLALMFYVVFVAAKSEKSVNTGNFQSSIKISN